MGNQEKPLPVNELPLAKRSTRGNGGRSQSVAGRVSMPLFLAFVSILIMLYPVVVTQMKNLEQIRVSSTYTAREAEADPTSLQNMFEQAQEYNKNRHSGPILDPWLARISSDNQEYQQYLAQLNTYEVMARLVIPSINVDLPVYHGSGEDSLQRGVGHLYGSDLPVGGEGTHAVLTAHSGLRNATLFDNLHKLKKGEAFYIGVSGQRLKYEVSSIDVVLPNETESLGVVAAADRVTLITCTPYGINSHRLLVHADRVPMDEVEYESFNQPLKLNWQWWMFALIGAALLLAVGMAVWTRKQVQTGRRAKAVCSGSVSKC